MMRNSGIGSLDEHIQTKSSDTMMDDTVGNNQMQARNLEMHEVS
jgi:hypothetical protein